FSAAYLLGTGVATGHRGFRRRSRRHRCRAVAPALARQATGCVEHHCPATARSADAEDRHPYTPSLANPTGLPDPGRLSRWTCRPAVAARSAFPNARGCPARRRAAVSQRLDLEPLSSCLHPSASRTAPGRTTRAERDRYRVDATLAHPQ